MLTFNSSDIERVRTIPNPDPDLKHRPIMSIKFKDGRIQTLPFHYNFRIK